MILLFLDKYQNFSNLKMQMQLNFKIYMDKLLPLVYKILNHFQTLMINKIFKYNKNEYINNFKIYIYVNTNITI